MPAQSAPQSAPTTIAKMMWRNEFIPSKDEPIQTAMTAPAMYWPVPPMLKRPHRKAKATARPVRISVVVQIKVCCMLSAAVTRSSPVTHGKNQLKPAPSKMARYVVSGLLPGRDEDDEAADEKCEHGRQHGGDQAAGLLGDLVAAEDATASPRGCRRGRAEASGWAEARPARSRRHLASRARHRSSRRRAPPPSCSGGNSPTISPSYMTRMRSESERISSSSSEIEQDASALVALLHEPAVHELDRADVEASRRLRGDQHARVAVDLACEHDLLLVAAREACRPRLRPAAAHVVVLDQLRRARRAGDRGRASRASSRARDGGSRGGRCSRRSRTRARARAAAGPPGHDRAPP